MKRSYIREILDLVTKETISFAGGLPDETLFDMKGLYKAGNEALQNPTAYQYSSSKGLEKLRIQIAQMYSQKFDFPTSKDEILITTGSQQAFDLISKMFITKGIIIEEPTYLGAMSSFSLSNKTLLGVSDYNKMGLFARNASAVYVMSDYSNPSTQCISMKKREMIAKNCKKEDLYLIEDGAYSLLSFDQKVQKPISSMSKEKSFLLGSFSKIIAPGLRVGFIRASKALIEKLLIAKEALDLHTPTLNQMIISNYLQENILEKQLEKVAQSYEKKMSFMAKCFEKYLASFEFVRPSGGMFIYGKFPNIDTKVLAKIAVDKGVSFVPGSEFYIHTQSNEARFNFSNSSYKQILKGVKLLSQSLEEYEKQKPKSMWFTLFQQRRA